MLPDALNSHDPALIDTTVEPETDAGPPRAGGKGARDPERRCIATMERRPQTQMIRFVLSPDGEVTPDLAARLPGRGAWVTSNREAVALALKKGAFGRAFKAQVKAAPDLADTIDRLLGKRVIDMLGLAKRAGDLILGFEKVREAIRAERPGCLIEASDGSEDGRNKMLGLARAIHGDMGRSDMGPLDGGRSDGVLSDGGGPEAGRQDGGRFGEGRDTAPSGGSPVPVAGCFTADELGMALGRERVIHACLKRGRFSRSWLGELTRLSGFRSLTPEDWGPGGWRPEGWRAQDGRTMDGLSATDGHETE